MTLEHSLSLSFFLYNIYDEYLKVLLYFKKFFKFFYNQYHYHILPQWTLYVYQSN